MHRCLIAALSGALMLCGLSPEPSNAAPNTKAKAAAQARQAQQAQQRMAAQRAAAGRARQARNRQKAAQDAAAKARAADQRRAAHQAAARKAREAEGRERAARAAADKKRNVAVARKAKEERTQKERAEEDKARADQARVEQSREQIATVVRDAFSKCGRKFVVLDRDRDGGIVVDAADGDAEKRVADARAVSTNLGKDYTVIIEEVDRGGKKQTNTRFQGGRQIGATADVPPSARSPRFRVQPGKVGT